MTNPAAAETRREVMTKKQNTEGSAELSDATAKAGSIWTELGPTLAFIGIYNVMLRFPEGEGLFTKDTALYWATGVLIVFTAFVIIQKLIRGERIPPFLIVSSALIGAFGTAGILLQSKLFLFIKPTIINLLYAGVIFGGLAVGRNIWKCCSTPYLICQITPGKPWPFAGGSILLPWRRGTSFSGVTFPRRRGRTGSSATS